MQKWHEIRVTQENYHTVSPGSLITDGLLVWWLTPWN